MNVVSSISSSFTPVKTSIKAISAIHITITKTKPIFKWYTVCLHHWDGDSQCQIHSKCAQISYQNIWNEFHLSQILVYVIFKIPIYSEAASLKTKVVLCLWILNVFIFANLGSSFSMSRLKSHRSHIASGPVISTCREMATSAIG